MSSANKQVRFGVIGYGLRGSLSKLAHRPEEGLHVVTLADTNPKAYPTARKHIGEQLECVEDYRKMLERKDIDAVFVLSPDYLHEEHAIACLEAGKAVYLEKPMHITVEGCDRILKTAAKTRAKLYVGHNMRHFDFTRAMKRMIDDGAIGEVQTAWARHFISYGGDAYFKDWHADRTKSTGLLLQKAAHDLDILHWLCGGHSVRVQAMGKLSVYNRVQNRLEPGEPYQAWSDKRWSNDNWPALNSVKLNRVIDVEDLSMLNAQLNNDVLISYQQCHYTPDCQRNYTVIGTEGRIENMGDSEGKPIIALWNKRYDGHKIFGDVQNDVTISEGGHGGADPKIVDEFIKYVRDDAPTSITPIEARNAVAVGYYATQSIRAGGKMMEIPEAPKL